jgi:hypothetical protein
VTAPHAPRVCVVRDAAVRMRRARRNLKELLFFIFYLQEF